jgi:hypothetical protein
VSIIRERPQHGTRPHYDVIPMRLSMLALISLVSVALALSLGIILGRGPETPGEPGSGVMLVRMALTVAPFVGSTLFVLELRRRPASLSSHPEPAIDTSASIHVDAAQVQMTRRHVA